MITKYKLSDLAKDLKLQPADIIEALSADFGQKKAAMSLTPEEVNYVLETFTRRNEVDSFEPYFADKTASEKPAPKPEKPKSEPKPKAQKPAPEAKKPEPEKQAPQPEKSPAAPKPETKPEAKPEAKPEPKAAPKPEQPQKQRREEKKQPAKKQDHGERQKLVTSGTGASSAAGGKQRVVDTRGSYVNIDKYNDRYDNLAENGRKNNENYQKKQKLVQKSKQQKKQQLSTKRETEAEKLRRLELERARKQQLRVTYPTR